MPRDPYGFNHGANQRYSVLKFWLFRMAFTGLNLLFSLKVMGGPDHLSGVQWKYFWIQADQKLLKCYLTPKKNCVESCPMECSIPGLGDAFWDEGTGQARWKASTDGQRVGGLGVEGTLDRRYQKGQVQRVLSNGFQSWSYSGLIELPPSKSMPILVEELSSEAMRQEEFRDGRSHSWEFGVLLDRRQFVFAGALTSRLWSSWVHMGVSSNHLDASAEPDISAQQKVSIIMVSGMNGDEVKVLRGESVSSEKWNLQTGQISQLGMSLRNYRFAIDREEVEGVPFARSKVRVEQQPGEAGNRGKIHLGWNSWYHLWNKVTQHDVLRNLSHIKPFLQQLGEIDSDKDRNQLTSSTPYATIDDGWQVMWGDWRPNAKFSSRLREIAQAVDAAGYTPGLWLAPFLVDIKSPFVLEHPNWFVGAPDFKHPSGVYKILDTTHPEVKDHLRGLFYGLKEASIKFVKLDFLYVGTFSGKRYKSVTSTQAYREGLSLIREVLGEGVEILACGAPHLLSRPYVDRWRIGPDIAYEYPTNAPVWIDIAIQARNIGARSFLCDRSPEESAVKKSFVCDSDPWLVRGRRKIREIQSALWVSSLTGSGLTLSDDFNRVPVERLVINMDDKAMKQALSGHAATPNFELWVKQKPASRLFGASPWERVWDTGGASINAPLGWRLFNHQQVLINFEPYPIASGDGIYVYPRGTHVGDPK